MEQVDIVDEKNHKLFQSTKQEAHEKGLLHRTIIAEVIDPQGRWILVKQAADRQDTGQYVSPVGGHIRAGESETEALKREAREELGLEDFTYKFVGRAIFNREVLGRKENHYFIIYEIYTDLEPILNYESDEFRRFTPQELKKEYREYSHLFGEAFHFVVSTFYNNLFK